VSFHLTQAVVNATLVRQQDIIYHGTLCRCSELWHWWAVAQEALPLQLLLGVQQS
jgi:predicted solute-binding protein